jgi:outer membrane lipoprotein SlyB
MLFGAGAVMLAVITSVFLATAVIAADEFVVYPAKGQSNDQMEKDKYECYQWAKNQSGFDPMKAPTGTTPPPQQKGGVVKGAAVGALAGVAVGAIAGDAGKGAAIGAVSGGVIGGVLQRRTNHAQHNAAIQEAQNVDQQRSAYNKAWAACMEGRGYTVK